MTCGAYRDANCELTRGDNPEFCRWCMQLALFLRADTHAWAVAFCTMMTMLEAMPQRTRTLEQAANASSTPDTPSGSRAKTPSEQPLRFLSLDPAHATSPLLHEPAEVLDTIFASHPVHRDQDVMIVLSSILDALPNTLHEAACRHHVRCRDGACNISLAGEDTAHAALQMLRCLPRV